MTVSRVGRIGGLVVAVGTCASLLALVPRPAAADNAVASGVTVTLLGAEAGSVGDINDAGQVVGTTADVRAFLWQGGSLRMLTPVDQGWSYARAINERGQVVGAATPLEGDSGPHPFLWEP